MVKVTKQQNEQNEQPKLPIKATVVVHESGFGKDKTEYIAADLINPFAGETFSVELTPKWKSDKGIFDYKARRLLQTQSSFEIGGYLTPVTYYSKARKQDVTVIGCFMENPFFAGEMEFRISDEEQYSVLSFYCSAAWGVKLSRYYGEEKVAVDDTEE